MTSNKFSNLITVDQSGFWEHNVKEKGDFFPVELEDNVFEGVDPAGSIYSPYHRAELVPAT